MTHKQTDRIFLLYIDNRHGHMMIILICGTLKPAFIAITIAMIIIVIIRVIVIIVVITI